MARIWKEPLDVDRHRDFVSGSPNAGGRTIDPAASDGSVYFVRECAFTFALATLGQLRDARDYFARTIHPARRCPVATREHYWQRWFERLPKGLVGATKRERIHRALERACEQFGADAATPPGAGTSS